MASADVDDLTKKLGETTVESENELSFKGKGLKLDKREDGGFFPKKEAKSNIHFTVFSQTVAHHHYS